VKILRQSSCGGTAPPEAVQNIRRIRRRLELTQAQFAERLGVTPVTVHRWESGQSRPQRIAAERLRGLEEELAGRQAAHLQSCAPKAAGTAPPLDFAGNPAAVSAVAEVLRLAHGHQFNPAFASEISRIDPLPHQRIAVYERMLRQEPLRFLLADDAGAGKTIMTGLYVREMLSRGRIRRVLVVPPAGLVGNWERELRTLFRLRFRIAARADPRADNPFRGPGRDLVIVSLDTLASEKTFAALREAGAAPYDLVVFDEAHKLSAAAENRRIRKTRRYELAEALAGCAAPAARFAGLGWAARHLLLLTATPHMGKDSPYHHLWRLLDPRIFSTGEAFRRFPAQARERYFIRRTKEEMLSLDGRPLYTQRACDTFRYDLNESERQLYVQTTDYLLRTYGRALDRRPAARLAMSVFQRRLASSTWALLRSFERRIEKLQVSIERLRSGAADSRRLREEREALLARLKEDFFDTHGADEDEGEEPGSEAHEEYELAVLGVTVAVTIEDLRSEIERLETLRDRARALCERGDESKFEKLQEVLREPRFADEKWLIFTEHRDTAHYLIRRLEGLGFSGRIAQVHGGMAWQERERQVGLFRQPDGARYLVATDAAGEGINLQFCRRMANYDIPWNPARLEQRLGRIHRYGQKHDVRIVNLVAGNTHEGRVLQVLLQKLEAVRQELSSDKVFDVIGRLFENMSLREYMLEALTDEGERNVLARVENAVKRSRVRDLEQEAELVYGKPGEVAERLDTLRNDMERERYLQLLPGYVRRLVEKSAELLDLAIRGDLDACFSLAPRRPGALDCLLPALGTYPAAARECLCVRRPESDAPCICLHPGEPVFDALCERIMNVFARDALRGAIFTDPRAQAPYLFHLALISVEQAPGEPAAPDLFAPAAPSQGRQILDSRLLALRQGEDGAPVECPVERLLLLRGAPGIAPGAVPLAGHGLGLRAKAASCAERQTLERLVEDRRAALRAELPERRRRLGVGFDLRAAELARDRTKLYGDGAAKEGELEAIKQEQNLLSAQRRHALAQLENEPERIVAGKIRFLAHALAVPADGAEESERYDLRIEEAAIRIALGWEKDRGASVRDVSRPELARRAGLPDWPGFDLLCERPGGEVRNIEVKGRADRGAVQMEANEWKQACHLGDRYWLYVVFDCAASNPCLVRVRNPFAKLLARSRNAESHTISAKSLLEAAEGDVV